MYCPKCGTENPDGAGLCSNCNWVLGKDTTTSENPNAKTSGLAIAALVFAILAFFTFGLTAIVALILGIIAIVKIEKSKGALKGKGLAIAGIVVPIILIPMMMIATLLPALGRVRQLAYRTTCSTNLSSLSKAMTVYANDYNEAYPTGEKWCDLLIEYADVDKVQFDCPSAEGECNYAVNEQALEAGPDGLPDLVLMFDSVPGWNQVGGQELLSSKNHQGDGYNVVFNDMHVEFVRSQDMNNLKWNLED